MHDTNATCLLTPSLPHLVQALYQYDCLRANKSTMAWGVEARVPFLDRDFLNVAMGIDAKDKMISKAEGKIEKYILRKAFDTPENPYLPENVLWRQKEQFSDGVGYSWIDGLKDFAASQVSAGWRVVLCMSTVETGYWAECVGRCEAVPGARWATRCLHGMWWAAPAACVQ